MFLLLCGVAVKFLIDYCLSGQLLTSPRGTCGRRPLDQLRLMES